MLLLLCVYRYRFLSLLRLRLFVRRFLCARLERELDLEREFDRDLDLDEYVLDDDREPEPFLEPDLVRLLCLLCRLRLCFSALKFE